ncbi:MAG: TonB-dependent receptor [Bacteroidia bacterium]|jgi:hypothetical protein|nr:TonB-dependent receptor [Bacteroidia bacterium]
MSASLQKLLLSLILSVLLLCLFAITSLAQTATLVQTVRGTVVDKQIRTPLPGAVVSIIDLVPPKGTATDVEGRFRLAQIPVGRHTLKVMLTGYEELMLNVDVTSGKELVLNIEMTEKVITASEVVIEATTDKEKPLNEMSSVSARTFSVEETQRFAAAVNDPARMAMSFAGVQSAGDGNNIIVIRGNAPNGLLWRMEGVEVPNPNHFSNVGTAGGGISILSAQLLTNSDFMTGAFAAEYGNALSGVFDLRLRPGNNEKREFTFQAGVLGIDAAVEGPFSKKYGGSYLINYRYSTLSLLSNAGLLPDDGGVTNFQDLSFNFVFPAGKAGTFSLFGFGGLSSQNYASKLDSTQWEEEWMRYGSRFIANTGAAGITHRIILGEKTYMHNAFVISGTGNGYNERYVLDNYQQRTTFDQLFNQQKVTLSTTVTHKFNAKHTLRSGLIINRLGFDFSQRFYDEDISALRTVLSDKGNTNTIQSYSQWQYRPLPNLTVNAGAHLLYLQLNGKTSVEPRAGARWEFLPRNTLSLGYGLHSQVLPLGTYFADVAVSENSTTTYEPNKNLGLSKAHHLVLGYERPFGKNSRIKAEVYQQWLFNIPVSADPTSSFSQLNDMGGFVTEALTNRGKGLNRGAELTIERFFINRFYYMLSASLYDSKYKALDGVWRNTRFNGSYAATFTIGKEYEFGNEKKRVLGINGKIVWTGGFRETPINLEASIAQGSTVVYENRAFENKLPDYFRADIRISLRRDFKKYSSTVSLDLQNATNNKNVFVHYFDAKSNTIKTAYQTPIIPVLSWRVQF